MIYNFPRICGFQPSQHRHITSTNSILSHDSFLANKTASLCLFSSSGECTQGRSTDLYPHSFLFLILRQGVLAQLLRLVLTCDPPPQLPLHGAQLLSFLKNSSLILFSEFYYLLPSASFSV